MFLQLIFTHHHIYHPVYKLLINYHVPPVDYRPRRMATLYINHVYICSQRTWTQTLPKYQYLLNVRICDWMNLASTICQVFVQSVLDIQSWIRQVRCPQDSNRTHRKTNQPLQSDVINTLIETCWNRVQRRGPFSLAADTGKGFAENTMFPGVWGEAQVNKTQRTGLGPRGQNVQRRGSEIKVRLGELKLEHHSLERVIRKED